MVEYRSAYDAVIHRGTGRSQLNAKGAQTFSTTSGGVFDGQKGRTPHRTRISLIIVRPCHYLVVF